MKKTLSLLVALCLLCGVAALAEEAGGTTTGTEIKTSGGTANTEVSYTIGTDETFVVTIPSGVAMAKSSEVGLTGSMKVSLEAPSFNVSNRKIVVKLTTSANGFKLKLDDSNSIVYTIKSGSSTTVLAAGDEILTWNSGSGDTSSSVTLNLAASLDGTLPSGKYTDTLTFTVSVDNTTSAEESK